MPGTLARAGCRGIEALAAQGSGDPCAVVVKRFEELMATDGLAIPSRLRPLADRLSTTIEYRPMDRAGRLFLGPDGWRIRVKADGNYRRARFTTAHELAHVVVCDLLQDDPAALRSLREKEHWHQLERLCERAAAELLMPHDDFQQNALRYGLTPAGLLRLYDRYLVSWEPLILRVREVFGLRLTRFTTYRRSGGERMTLRALANPRDEWWLPAGITSRHICPDLPRAALANGFAVCRSTIVDLSHFGSRRPAMIATSLMGARELAAARRPVSLDGFVAPDSQAPSFQIALFTTKSAGAQWEQLASMAHDTGEQ